MANGIKTYKIVINGVQESIDAVKSLNEQLKSLEDRIKVLESKTINIKATSSTSTTGGGSKSSSVGQLSEEDKLLKQIEQTERKIKAYSKDIYQNYMASKDQLKEVLNDQKQIAAQERLQANTYSNTMQGLKEKLADIKNVMQTTDIGSDIFKKYTAEANEITNKLKELEQAYGQFGRNVGNYSSAFDKYTVKVGDTVREFNSARQAAKELQNELLNLPKGAKGAEEIHEALLKVRSDIKDLSTSSKVMDNLLDTMQGFTAIASIGTGISTLFGLEDNEELNETIKKMGSLLMIMQGIEVVNKQLKSGDNPIFNWLKGIDEKFVNWAENIGEKVAFNFYKGFKEATEKSEKEIVETIASGDFGKMEEELNKFNDKYIYGLFKRTDVSETGDDVKEFIELVRKAGEEGVKFSELFKQLSDTQKGWAYSIVKSAENYISSITKVANFAVKTITMVGRLIAGVITGIAFSYLIDGINYVTNAIGEWIKGNADLIDSEKKLNAQIEITNHKLEERLRLNQALEKSHKLSVVGREIEDEKAYAEAIAATNEELLKRANIDPKNSTFAKAMKNAGRQSGIDEFLQNDEGVTTFGGFTEAAKDIDELMKRYNALSEAVDKNTGLVYKNAKGIEIAHLSASDARDELNHIEQFLAGNMVGAMTQFDVSTEEGRKGLEQFVNGILKSNDTLYKSLLLRLPQIVSDNEGKFGTALDKYLELIKQFASQADQEMKQFKFSEMVESILDQADETGKRQAERRKKELTQRYEMLNAEQQKQEKEHYEQGLAALDKMQQRAANNNLQKAKEQGKKLADAENQLIALRIENMKNGLKKRLAELDNQRRLELDKVKEDGVMVGELSFEINKKYDRLVLDEKRKWAFDMLRTYEDLMVRINQFNKSTYDIEIANAQQNVDSRTRRRQSETGYEMITPSTYDDSKALEEYYKKIVDIKKKAAEREYAIEQKRLDKQLETDKKEEELRHKRLIDENGGEFISQLRAGLITQEEYDKLIEDENDAHYARMNAIDKQYASNLSAATEDNLEKVQKLYSDYYGNIINNIRKDKSNVDEIMSKQPATLKGGWGIVNIGQTSSNYEKALADYDKLRQEILKKQSELEQDLKNHNISAEDFAIRQDDLKKELKAIDDACTNVKERQNMLIGDFIQSIRMYVQAGLQGIQDVFNAVWDYQDYQFEKEQDELDKLNDELDKKLDEQEKIVEKHKSAIDEIEDELSTARGDRRQHLIDQLNAEMQAQRAAAAQEKKIQREKEAAEKKQEQLEKKRREAEYKRNVIQAFISWHMAIANGLATQPFLPVGIAMGALATALGAVQYALVKSQKPYAKGGQLDGGVAQGKRHRDGGIPVLGGRASIEGGEFITNRITTQNNVALLDYINSKKKRIDLSDLIGFYGGDVKKNVKNISPKRVFADGGVIPTINNDIDINDRLVTAFEKYSEKPTVVSVVDINNRQNAVKNVQVLAGLSD